MALLGAGDIPLDAAREAGDDVLRHPQQGRPPRLQEVHASTYMFLLTFNTICKAVFRIRDILYGSGSPDLYP
jgi:hypothetical protein